MIGFDDIRDGVFYSCGDDALYKVVIKKNDWCLILQYSYNHNVCVPKFINEEWWNGIAEHISEEQDQSCCQSIIDELVFADNSTLKS